MAPSWIRNPQDPADEHEWVRWFDNPLKYRGMVWSEKAEQWVVKEPKK